MHLENRGTRNCLPWVGGKGIDKTVYVEEWKRWELQMREAKIFLFWISFVTANSHQSGE